MSAEENEMKNRHPADENEKTMPETGADSFAAGEETDFCENAGQPGSGASCEAENNSGGTDKGNGDAEGQNDGGREKLEEDFNKLKNDYIRLYAEMDNMKRGRIRKTKRRLSLPFRRLRRNCWAWPTIWSARLLQWPTTGSPVPNC